MSADLFRYATMVLSLVAMITMPWAIWHRIRTPAVVLIVVVMTLQYLGSIIAVSDSIGEPLVWWRTPRIFVAAFISLVYVAFAATGRRAPR